MKIPTQKVRRKSDGEVCTINAGPYDGAVYEPLEAPKEAKVEKVEKPADRGRRGRG